MVTGLLITSAPPLMRRRREKAAWDPRVSQTAKSDDCPNSDWAVTGLTKKNKKGRGEEQSEQSLEAPADEMIRGRRGKGKKKRRHRTLTFVKGRGTLQELSSRGKPPGADKPRAESENGPGRASATREHFATQVARTWHRESGPEVD